MLCVHRLWSKRNDLSSRLTRTYALLFAATMVIFSLIVYFVSWHFLFDRRKQELLGSVEHIVDIYYEEVSEGHDPLEQDLLWELNTNESMSLLLLSPSRQPLSQATNFDVSVSEIPDCNQKTVLYTQSNGLSLLAWEKDILLDGDVLGTMTFLLEVQREYDFLEMLAWLLVILNLGGCAAALAVGWITSRRMLTPISEIIQKANAIDEGTLHTRLEVPETQDELRQLTTTLNDMLNRVENAFLRQGQFTQDASHELRTPLAVLQGNADLLARWGKDDPSVRDKCIAAIQKQTAYMHHLVANLLFLSRGDSGVQNLRKQKIDLRETLSEIAEERGAFDTAHVYRLQSENIAVSADENLLRQLLLILLDNAAKYTPKGKAISIEAVSVNAQTEIRVRDEGCGVPEEQLQKIFDRFYRVDKARARETGGTGLGLAIAQTIVNMHGGRIWAENNEQGGLTVRVRLP